MQIRAGCKRLAVFIDPADNTPSRDRGLRVSYADRAAAVRERVVVVAVVVYVCVGGGGVATLMVPSTLPISLLTPSPPLYRCVGPRVWIRLATSHPRVAASPPHPPPPPSSSPPPHTHTHTAFLHTSFYTHTAPTRSFPSIFIEAPALFSATACATQFCKTLSPPTSPFHLTWLLSCGSCVSLTFLPLTSTRRPAATAAAIVTSEWREGRGGRPQPPHTAFPSS
jgi:hypothetical protein